MVGLADVRAKNTRRLAQIAIRNAKSLLNPVETDRSTAESALLSAEQQAVKFLSLSIKKALCLHRGLF